MSSPDRRGARAAIRQTLSTYWYVEKMFFKRGIWFMASYRTGLLLRFLTVFVWCSVFFFMGKMLNGNASPALERYGGDFFSFVIIGWAMQRFISSSLHNLENTIEFEIETGNIEFMALSNINLPFSWHYLASAYMYFSCGIDIALYLLVGRFIFGLSFSAQPHLGLALLVLLLMILSNSAIAIVSGGIILLTKKGNPLTWFFDQMAFLISGVYFPFELLPGLIRGVAPSIPLTRAMRSFRFCLLASDVPFETVRPIVISDLIYLGVFTLVLTPLAMKAFTLCLRKARREGILYQY